MDTVIKIDNLSKLYRLGEIGTGTVSHDLNRWWAKLRGKEDPFAKVGHTNDRTAKAEKGEMVWALKDINLEVKEGEVLGIIGKNGAGKSTLLKILSRVTSPTTGSIKVKGRIASLLEVGTGFHPEMTGRENIYMNGTIMGMRKWEIDKKLDEIVDFAGVTKYIDTPVKRYSSGMTVRLGFAVAAHLEPEILVVDEVLAVGDAEFQKKAIGKMQEVSQGQGRTVLFVSHNMGAVRGLCQTGLVLNKGKIIESKSKIDQAIELYVNDTFSREITNINNRTDRSGSGDVKIVDLKIDNLNKDSELRVDQTLSFTVKYRSNYEKIKGNLLLSINTLENVCICFLDSSIINSFNNELGQTGIINIKLSEDFALAPGRYYISIALLVNDNIADYVQRALVFSVTEGLFFLNGKMPKGKSLCFVKQNWEVRNE
jgi:lipopolysaccharide transport system ATP-binding protein